MACLDTTRTAALVAGALPGPERRVAEGHLAACDRCRRLVSEAARDPSHLGRLTEPGFAGSDGDAGAGEREPRPGDRVGDRFVLRGVLGTGGMGVVYDAYDERLQRPVALKQIRRHGPVDGSSDSGDDAWIFEARALARLHHPNVVTLYEVVAHAGTHFLALERVDGVTLRGWLRARRRTSEEILEVFLAAAHGLEAAHAAGIVHRDFKPDNVLVGRDGRVRVADFGLARSMAGCEPVAAGGTPRYVAPEQARGEPPDARGDQYSFAVALLEALAGATAAAGGRRDGGRGNDGDSDPPPLGPADLPTPLWRVIRRALAVSPRERHPSLSALIAALVRVRRRRRARRRLTLAGAVASLLLAATANGAWRAHLESVRTRERLAQAREGEGQKAREAAWLRAHQVAMADEADRLRSRQAETAEEAAALRAQIVSLAAELAAAASTQDEARTLRRLLRQRETQLRALTRGLSERRAPAPAAGSARPFSSDQSPHPLVVERHVRRLSRPLQACLTGSDGLVRLPADLGGTLVIGGSGRPLGAEVTGIEQAGPRTCLVEVLATLRLPAFQHPVTRTYAISLSWLGLEARMRGGK